MLYPVELQGPPRARVGDSGGKDRQAFSPTKPARQKLHEKRNPHRRRPMALPPRGFTDADPPGKRPLFRAFAPSGLRHPAMTLAGHAGHPGDFTRRRQSEPKSIACSTSCSRPTQRDPPKSVRLPHKACALFDQHDCSCRDGVLVLHCWRPRFVTLLLSPTALGVRGDGVVQSTWTVLRPAMPSRRHPLRTFVQSNQASSFDSARIPGRSSVIRTGPPFFRWAGLSFRWQIQVDLSSVDQAVDLLGCSKEGTNSSLSQTFPLIRIHLEFTRFVHNC